MKKQLGLALTGLVCCSSLFAMASSNTTGQPSMENYK